MLGIEKFDYIQHDAYMPKIRYTHMAELFVGTQCDIGLAIRFCLNSLQTEEFVYEINVFIKVF